MARPGRDLEHGRVQEARPRARRAAGPGRPFPGMEEGQGRAREDAGDAAPGGGRGDEGPRQGRGRAPGGEDERLESLLKGKLLAKDEQQVKNTFLEIRAGTGGEEAALFARDLFAMYMKYAEKMRWKTELLNMSMSDLGGFKEVVVAMEAPEAFQRLKLRERRPPGAEGARRRSPRAGSTRPR